MKIQTAVKRHHIILSKATPWPYLIDLWRHSDVTVTSNKVTACRITMTWWLPWKRYLACWNESSLDEYHIFNIRVVILADVNDLWRHKRNLSTNHMHCYYIFFCFTCSSSDPMGDFWLIFFSCAEAISVSFKCNLDFSKNSPKFGDFWKFSIFYLKISRFCKKIEF